MHDAVTRRDHLDIAESQSRPVDEVETVFVTPILDRAVLGERVRIVAAALDGQRMIDDQLDRDHRVDRGRVSALIGNRIPQTGQIDQGGLAEDVVAHDARRKPRKIQVSPALDQLDQAVT
jgi:hypothetical protein